LKIFSDNYIKKSQDLGRNLNKLNKNIELLHIDYMNSLNSLKNISIKKFVEHIVDDIVVPVPEVRKETIPLSREEREGVLLNKFRNAISISLEGLNIKNLIDIKDSSDNVSSLEDDAVSVTSSRYFSNMNKQSKGVKLPFIIGTNEFFKSEYLGVSAESVKEATSERSLSIHELDKNLGNTLINIEKSRASSMIVPPSTQGKGVVSSIPNIPSVPNVPKVPAVPNIPSVPNIPNLPGNVPGVSNKRVDNPTNLIKNEEEGEDDDDVSPTNFKGNLNKRLGHSNTISIKSSNIAMETSNNIHHPKNVKLDNFVKKENYNMFDIPDEEEDEEDMSALFRKNTTVQLKKSTLFNNQEEKVVNKPMGKANLFNEDEIISTKEKEKPKNMDLESNNVITFRSKD
jgi:hypothetical protein